MLFRKAVNAERGLPWLLTRSHRTSSCAGSRIIDSKENNATALVPSPTGRGNANSEDWCCSIAFAKINSWGVRSHFVSSMGRGKALANRGAQPVVGRAIGFRPVMSSLES